MGNPTNQNVPRGHSMCGATTMHLILSEIPRVYRPFIFYDHYDTSQRPQNPGAADWIDKPNLPA